MKKFVAAALMTTVMLVAARPAEAVTRFRAIITHEQENPPIPDEGASGIGFFELNDAMNALSYDITLMGLDIDGNQTPGNANDNVTRTHIHNAPPGVNGGIVFGQIDPSPTLRNDLDDLMVDPVAGTIKGVWDNLEGNGPTNILANHITNLFNGDLYFNVHTTDHGGGEVRGQILFIPEPASLALCLLACVPLIGRRRR